MTRNAKKLHEMNAEVRFSNRLKLWDYQLSERTPVYRLSKPVIDDYDRLVLTGCSTLLALTNDYREECPRAESKWSRAWLVYLH